MSNIYLPLVKSPTPPDADPEYVPVMEIYSLVNYERKIEGLSPLRTSTVLRNAATEWSKYMAQTPFWGHSDMGANPYPFRAECIAAGYNSEQGIYKGWRESKPHWEIFMHPHLERVGIGYWKGGPYDHYWTASFGGGVLERRYGLLFSGLLLKEEHE